MGEEMEEREGRGENENKRITFKQGDTYENSNGILVV